MKRFSIDLTISFLALLVLGLAPLQAVHAQTMSMDEQSSAATTGCAGPCTASSPIAVVESQRSVSRQDEVQKGETAPAPYYLLFTQSTRSTQSLIEPEPCHRHYQPPDLVLLYANIRC